jgi:outer membrane protein assembly factor BamB/ubiquinone/menaquinone biosynthesis C-methylase UbiE
MVNPASGAGGIGVVPTISLASPWRGFKNAGDARSVFTSGRSPFPLHTMKKLLSLLLAFTGLQFVAAATAANAPEAALARELVQRAGITRGVCAVLGGEGGLPIALARSSGMLVHVREPDAARVDALRAAADKAGFDLQRLAVEQGSLHALPYTDNSVDLVLGTRAEPGLLKTLSAAEVLRVLRPEGMAIIGSMSAAGEETARELRDWAGKVTSERLVVWNDAHGTWLQLRKPPLKGAADWSHWEKSPDNNPVSDDQIIKAPYLTQFMETPFYIGMPAVTTAAGGRTFLAIGHIAHHDREWETLGRIVARNGYNGQVLWERKLPEGYLVHRSAFIATKDTFYMMEGGKCLLLDPETGREKGRIEIPGVEGEWKWMAIKDGVLYVMSGPPDPPAETVKGDRALGGWSWADLSKGYYGKRIPHGFGNVVAAYELEHKNVLWKHTEEVPIDSRGMAIREDRLFLYCPDHHLRSLSTASGSLAWSNDDPETLNSIEEPGKGLTSTPGWRTQTLVVATPKALIIQGQTHMNVIGVSTETGRLLWKRTKVTNNPNAIYVDDQVIVGVGERGSNVIIDPLTGETVEDLGFTKRACTRLTASTDSFFCRGEGMIRFDRGSKKLTIDGAARPACNDGVIPANGLIYLGPWSCDCNLSLIGAIARCSAGDFKFDHVATAERHEKAAGPDDVKPLPVLEGDWPTYRGNNHRSAGTSVRIGGGAAQRWLYQPERPRTPTEATAAGGLVFFGGEDGKVRALDATNGEHRWTFATAGIVKYPPTIAEGRALFGSGDGYVYCLEAASGRLLWRFRAAPVERHLMIYGAMSSTWPVNTGVLVQDGVAYFAAGIVDQDGTYVYALDAKTGEIRWQNNATGHLNADLRKGVSAQGNLSVRGDTLLLAGGNVISPAMFDLKTGRSLDQARAQGQPQANGGKFVGVMGDGYLIAGGRILYASPRNVATKGSFVSWSPDRRSQTLNFGGIPPAWNDETIAVVNFKYGSVVGFNTAKVTGAVTKETQRRSDAIGPFQNNLVTLMTARQEERWQSNLAEDKFEAVALALTPNALLTVASYQVMSRARPQWFLLALDPQTGRRLWQQELPGEPLPDALLVDRAGRILVTLMDGGMVCYAGRQQQAGL